MAYVDGVYVSFLPEHNKPTVALAKSGVQELLEREIDFLQRQIEARSIALSGVQLANLEITLRPLLLKAVEDAANPGEI